MGFLKIQTPPPQYQLMEMMPVSHINGQHQALDTERTFKFCFQSFDFKAFVASLLHWPYIIVIVQQKQHLVVLLTLVCASLQWWH